MIIITRGLKMWERYLPCSATYWKKEKQERKSKTCGFKCAVVSVLVLMWILNDCCLWVTCVVVLPGERNALCFWILWGDHLRIRLVFTVSRTLWSYRRLTFLCRWKMGSCLQGSSKFKRHASCLEIVWIYVYPRACVRVLFFWHVCMCFYVRTYVPVFM